MADAPPKVSKPFIVIAGVGVLVIAAFLALKVLGGGGGGGSDSASSPSTAAAAATGAPSASTTTTTAPAAPTTPNQSFDVFTTKNPFQPLVTDTASTPIEPPVTDTVPDTSTVTPPATIPTDQAPSAGTPVSVLEVVDESGVVSARVQVGSQVYTVKVGDTFATSYRVVTLDQSTGCGQFQYGDTPFVLCTGQQTLK